MESIKELRRICELGSRMNPIDRKRAVIEAFNRRAHPSHFFTSDRTGRRAKIREHKIVANMLSRGESDKDKRALDVGCGVGGYFNILLERGSFIVGFDIAEKMVKVCRTKYGAGNNIELMIADAEYMPFKPKSFDVILCIDTLQYMGEASRRFVLQSIVELAKPEGRIIVEVKNKACPIYSLKRCQDSLAEQYSIASVTSVLKARNCKIEAVKGVSWPTFLAPIVVVKAKKENDEASPKAG